MEPKKTDKKTEKAEVKKQNQDFPDIPAASEKQNPPDIDKKDIKIDEAVKQAGSFPFKIKLYPGMDAEMTLKVETE